VNGDTVTEEFDDELELFTIQAKHAWELLQQRVWGVHWDYSQPCLDYSRASLLRLSDWLLRAARGEGVTEFQALVIPAWQYLGETVLEHARGDWERRPDGLPGVAVECTSSDVRHVDITAMIAAWVAAVRGGKGAERPVLVEQFDRAIAGALPPIRLPD
jgi:hypothetical protein